ncbi:hypothetical protein HDU76_008088 [Blyttiomyces sp. JEL0837]|nr:hypothetical protein HDU76_008088 [Blyttiomyces sp. JEL0837]
METKRISTRQRKPNKRYGSNDTSENIHNNQATPSTSTSNLKRKNYKRQKDARKKVQCSESNQVEVVRPKLLGQDGKINLDSFYDALDYSTDEDDDDNVDDDQDIDIEGLDHTDTLQLNQDNSQGARSNVDATVTLRKSTTTTQDAIEAQKTLNAIFKHMLPDSEFTSWDNPVETLQNLFKNRLSDNDVEDTNWQNPRDILNKPYKIIYDVPDLDYIKDFQSPVFTFEYFLRVKNGEPGLFQLSKSCDDNESGQVVHHETDQARSSGSATKITTTVTTPSCDIDKNILCDQKPLCAKHLHCLMDVLKKGRKAAHQSEDMVVELGKDMMAVDDDDGDISIGENDFDFDKEIGTVENKILLMSGLSLEMSLEGVMKKLK